MAKYFVKYLLVLYIVLYINNPQMLTNVKFPTPFLLLQLTIYTIMPFIRCFMIIKLRYQTQNNHLIFLYLVTWLYKGYSLNNANGGITYNIKGYICMYGTLMKMNRFNLIFCNVSLVIMLYSTIIFCSFGKKHIVRPQYNLNFLRLPCNDYNALFTKHFFIMWHFIKG